jgi:hypothetical protein
MKATPTDRDEPSNFQLLFQPLFDTAYCYTFPCDANGHVDMDALSERARNSYLYARTVVGRVFSIPKVHRGTAS